MADNHDLGIAGLDDPPHELPAGVGRAESSLRRLTVSGKPFYVLRQRGRFADIAYDHGRLLAAEIEEGAFPEILSSIGRGTDLGGRFRSGLARSLFRGLSERIVSGVSAEFRDALGALADGYRDGMERPRFSRRQAIDALVAIELDNLVEGLMRRLSTPATRGSAIREVLGLVVFDDSSAEIDAFLRGSPDDAGVGGAVAEAVARLAHADNRTGFACTGFSVPAGMTRDGRHLHARNLDADLYNWNLASTLFLIDETEGRPDRHRYVAFGTAGLIYPGGISGLNDAGIGVSLHQLSTVKYRTRGFSGRADIAPFVQQRILREAASLEDAVEIARATQAFAAWVICCSDARTGRSRQIEFNAESFRLGPETTGPLAQTNHFRHPDLVERLFDGRDAHVTPTLGKWLETRSRLAMVEAKLSADAPERAIDTGWAVELLASGRDAELVDLAARRGLASESVGVERSFGRVPRKAYGQLGSVVRADPARRPGRDEAWMTIGERLPACQSTYVGWRIDWDGLDLRPVPGTPLRRTRQCVESRRGDWEASFETYRSARVAFARPRDAMGVLLDRNPDAAQRLRDTERAEALLSEAIAQAASDRVVEVPYHYMRARIRHQLGRYDAARADWDLLRAVWGDPPVQAAWPVAPRVPPLLHEYEAGLVLLLSVVTEDRALGDRGWNGREDRLRAARDLLAGVRGSLFGAGAAHPDLLAWLGRIDALLAGDEVELPEPNFVTIE